MGRYILDMDTSDKREALIIDASVEQMDTLLEGLNSSVRAPRSVARDDDPAQSIRHFLDDPSVTSLHVLGHGRPGGVRIGSRWLTADDFRVDADVAAARPEPLEIYFWSCHTGADAAGKTFMQNIAEHSMANVFASTDLIGDKDQGGNWELNASATPRAVVPFSQEARDAFGVVLAEPTSSDVAITVNEGETRFLKRTDFPFNDADSDSFSAIQIGASTVGEIQYLDEGNWIPIESLAVRQFPIADLDNDQVRYVADPDKNGDGLDSFQFSVIDDSNSGDAGSQFYTATVDVVAVNDAPVASGDVTLTAVDEDTTDPAGATVSSLVSSSFDDSTDGVAGGSSADSFAGIAITGYTEDKTKGEWQFSLDGESSWTAVSDGLTDNSALILAAADELRFVPAADFNGAAPDLTVRLLEDLSNFTAGSTGDVSTNGGETAISAETIAIQTSINAVNDAPVVDTPNSVLAGSVTENASGDATPAQDAVASGNVAFTDVDAGDSLTVSTSTAETDVTLAYTASGDETSTSLPFGLDAAALRGAFSITNTATGAWEYDASALDLEALGSGDTVELTYTVTGEDAAGATADEQVTVTLTGTNDAPVVTGDTTGGVTEGDIGDAPVTATGTLTITDVDADDSPSFADVASTAGDNNYGSFELTRGTWTYTL
ncbi:hypothetical protein A6K26_009475, partial [Gammaproteobacteria bacterium 2W06]